MRREIGVNEMRGGWMDGRKEMMEGEREQGKMDGRKFFAHSVFSKDRIPQS